MRKLLVAAALAAAALAGSAPAATPTVSIHDNGMEPPLLVVPVGSEVTWRNDGRLQHQTKGGLWESPVLAPSATFAFRFTRLGSYRYEDPLHPGLRGTIWVVPAGRSTSPPKGSRQTTYGAVVDVRVVERITLWDSVMRATHGTCVIEEGTSSTANSSRTRPR